MTYMYQKLNKRIEKSRNQEAKALILNPRMLKQKIRKRRKARELKLKKRKKYTNYLSTQKYPNQLSHQSSTMIKLLNYRAMVIFKSSIEISTEVEFTKLITVLSKLKEVPKQLSPITENTQSTIISTKRLPKSHITKQSLKPVRGN